MSLRLHVLNLGLKSLKSLKMFKLRKYQKKASIIGFLTLQKHKILILNYEVRTGKTHIALEIAKNYNSVLFVTKKKAIQGMR